MEVCLSDDELIQALEREREMFHQRGQTVRAAQARRLASSLRHAAWEHRAVLDDLCLRSEVTGSDKGLTSESWERLTGARGQARQFLFLDGRC